MARTKSVIMSKEETKAALAAAAVPMPAARPACTSRRSSPT